MHRGLSDASRRLKQLDHLTVVGWKPVADD